MRKLVKELKNKNLTISLAESMTGGYLSSKITKVSGASKVFKGAIIAYNSNLKVNLLNVNSKTIDKNSVVSLEVADEMATGLKNIIDSDIYIAITGNAGPTLEPNTKNLVCYITILYNDKIFNHVEVFTSKNRFSNIKRIEKVVKNIVYNAIL